MHWLYPANIKFYDVFGAFKKSKVYWPMNSKVSVNDIVYIYLSAPYKQIAFVCKVNDVNLELSEIIEFVKIYAKNEIDDNKKAKLFMQLQVNSRINLNENPNLSYQQLKLNGLNGMLMGPRKLENNPTLLKYIKRNL